LADSIFEKHYTLRGSDFDLNKQIKPSAVLDLFQEVAGQHAYELGIGFTDMLQKGYLWVVLKVKYQVLKAPELYQGVKVSTWPLKQKRLDLQRYYLF
jgi:acyl-ACP thioesterase